MDKLYIVIPAYNESENIEAVAREWHTVVEAAGGESRLMIIDDGSRDDTYAKLQALSAELPRLEAVTKPNGGHGPTCTFGYRRALEAGADYVFQTDSDGQTLPSEFPRFWELREGYDMVIGHRNHRQDGPSRVFVTKVLKLAVLFTFRVRVTDANTPFRLMKASFLREALSVIPDDFNLPNVVISAFAVKRKKKVLFLPITFRPRQGGKNSINFKKITKIGRKAVVDFTSLGKKI